jgi:NADPH:quinone reductase-like Zn-dependent oxidoreductase
MGGLRINSALTTKLLPSLLKIPTNKMRGWVFRTRGTPADVLKLETDLPQPTANSLGSHEVLVKVKYAALFQGSAAMMTFIPHFNDKPWVAENSYSGTVVATGAEVEHVVVDDAVFGGFAADVLRKYGGVLAEYVVLPDNVVTRKPSNVSLKDIAGMGTGGVTAMQFAEAAELKQGDRVLITGASGGTGTLVVQAARAAVGDEGLVVGTCSAANEQLVKDLGVHEVGLSTAVFGFVNQ